jgi:hypothetical protein
MPHEFAPREVFAISNPNKAWVVNELDKLRREWSDWLEVAKGLGDSPDFNPNTCTEAIKDGWDNIRKHDVLKERTLVFIGNNFTGYGFVFANWPTPPHEDVTSRIRKRVPGWMHRLEVLSSCIEYARVPDGFWMSKGKQLVDEVIKATPEKAIAIAASYLKNPMAD